MEYLYPCMPNKLHPDSKYFDELDRDIRWIAEIKKNGWRCLVMKDTTLQLWNRHRRIILDALPSIRETLSLLPNETLLDGELLFSKRVKGSIDGLYLFDILFIEGNSVINKPLIERRRILEKLYDTLLSHNPIIELAEQVQIGKKQLFYQSIEGLNEGIVLKKLDSIYNAHPQSCQQNPYWLKVKRVENYVYVKGDE